MKKIITFSFLAVVASLLSVGCTASAGIHKADATKLDTTKQVAYVTTAAK